MKKYLLALDQGTTSSRAIVFDAEKEMTILAVAQKDIIAYYPKEGWVEHDPMELYGASLAVMTEAVAKSGIEPNEIAAIGITNQRETTIVWEKATGRPIANAIVWQCRRTSDSCEQLKKRGLSEYIRENTGLVIDAYFSGTKIAWLLDNTSGARKKAENGELLFGTVDSWLVYKLTGGEAHVTDFTNASRTMLFNIKTLEWDKFLLHELDIPRSMLPEVKNSSEVYGYCNLSGANIPIAGIAGDQQAALFGQCCFESGEAKNTYGTGCFLLMNTGGKIYSSNNGLITTIASGINGKINYALEGSVFIGGAVIQWLRDELRFITESNDSEYFAEKISDSAGVYVVPAFTGLGAPHWDMYAKGTIFGMTRATNQKHIIRASLESIAYQSKDVIDALESDTGILLKALRVDGGASANGYLMQFQADILDKDVIRPKIVETSALGAAFLAGLAVGVFANTAEISAQKAGAAHFSPEMDEKRREQLLFGWKTSIGCTRAWSQALKENELKQPRQNESYRSCFQSEHI